MLDRGDEHIRFRARDRQADPPLLANRYAVLELAPVRAAIDALVDARCRVLRR